MMTRVIPTVAVWVVMLMATACDPFGFGSPFEPTITGKSLTVSGLSNDEDCPTCLSELTEPWLGHQTPKQLVVGLVSVELLRSPFDLNPHVVVAYEEPEMLDLLAGATFAEVDTGSIPPGTYPLMRVTLAYTRFIVDATAHIPFSGLHPGDLAVHYALSEYEDPEYGPRSQGDYEADFTAGDVDLPFSANQPIVAPPPYPGAGVDTSGGRYRVTFPSPQTVAISRSAPTAIDVDVTFFIEDGFAWFERAGDDNEEGIFDLSINPLSGETPASLGISGFAMSIR